MLVLAGQLNQASKEDLLVFSGGVQMVKTYMFILEAASLNVILIVSGYLYFGSYRLIFSASEAVHGVHCRQACVDQLHKEAILSKMVGIASPPHLGRYQAARLFLENAFTKASACMENRKHVASRVCRALGPSSSASLR